MGPRTGAENLASTGIRSPDRLARDESLYRLSCLGPSLYIYYTPTQQDVYLNDCGLSALVQTTLTVRLCHKSPGWQVFHTA